MRIFKVPFDIKREEKIFGGYLSIRQVLYIILGASSLVICVTPIPLIIKITFILIFSTFFLMCAFFKVGGLNFDKFFFYALKYASRKKTYLYERCSKC